MSEWISVKDELPEVGKRVQVCYERRTANGKTYKIVTVAAYVDGLTPEDDLLYDFSEFGNLDMGYDEENDRYLAPKGWYEELSSTNSEYFCILADYEVVTHWMALPEPPKEE